jgi:peptidyl-prolyl cis-trans isomerase D
VEIFNQITAVQNEFATTEDPAAFLVRNGSETPYFDGYVLKSKMQVSNTDTIQQLPKGAIFGPYQDGGNYALAKMIDIRTLPDSVFARHILVRTSGENATPDSIAKRRIDSIEAAIRGGADFVTLMNQLSDDKEANKLEGGIMTMNSLQIQNKEGFDQDFARFIFLEGKKGDRKVVKTQFGYHYIDIVDQKNFEPAYKVAYFTKAIVASDATDVAAMGLASQFAAESRNRKKFEETTKKKNLNRFTATDIKPLESNIQGVGESRELVRWMYEAEVGDVADRPFRVADKYVVPVLIQALDEGVMGAQKARPMVEFIIRNQKKAAQITTKLGSANTLDAVSKAVNQPVSQTDSVLFNSPFIPNIGQEMKFVGASFNKQNQTKISEPIPGNGGVFVLKINNITAMANPDFDAAQQQAAMQQMQQRNFSNPQAVLEILKKTVKIKDNRAKFF